MARGMKTISNRELKLRIKVANSNICCKCCTDIKPYRILGKLTKDGPVCKECTKGAVK